MGKEQERNFCPSSTAAVSLSFVFFHFFSFCRGIVIFSVTFIVQSSFITQRKKMKARHLEHQ